MSRETWVTERLKIVQIMCQTAPQPPIDTCASRAELEDQFNRADNDTDGKVTF